MTQFLVLFFVQAILLLQNHVAYWMGAFQAAKIIGLGVRFKKGFLSRK